MDLAERVAWLLIPVEEALRGHEVYELDPVLILYLRNLNSCVPCHCIFKPLLYDVH